jgi:hypothetical protein
MTRLPKGTHTLIASKQAADYVGLFALSELEAQWKCTAWTIAVRISSRYRKP